MPIELTKLPRHVAIIMDGNGRWAQEHGLPRVEGHRQGAKALKYAKEGSAAAKKANNRDLEGHFKELMAAAEKTTKASHRSTSRGWTRRSSSSGTC